MARGRRAGEEREEGGKGGKKRKKRKKGEGKKEKKIEKERKWGKGEERKEKGGGRCAPAATAGAVGHAWRAARGRWGTRRGREGKRRGGIRGGRSRRVALDGKKMGRGLNSGVGLLGGGSGD